MSLAINLIDQTTSGDVVGRATLKLVSERMTLRELLSKRISEEVDRFNQEQQQNIFTGLIQPNNTVRALKGYKVREPRMINFEQQMKMAVEAFQSNGFFVLLDDNQVGDLDEPLTLRDDSTVSFIKLVPLVGG